MWPTIRAMGAYRRRDDRERISALRNEAERHPDGHAKWLLAIALWEENDLAEAYRLAEPLLEEDPQNFDMLAIGLAFHLRSGDAKQIDSYARRLAVVNSPARTLRVSFAVLSVLLFPLWLLGYGRNSGKYADVLDAWSLWAREYARNNPQLP